VIVSLHLREPITVLLALAKQDPPKEKAAKLKVLYFHSIGYNANGQRKGAAVIPNAVRTKWTLSLWLVIFMFLHVAA